MTKARLCLVTGGAGFIGSHLVEALVAHGFNVRVLDDLSSGNLENLSAVIDQIEFMEGSITENKSLTQALRSVDLVFHLAAMVAVPESIDKPLKCLELNDLSVFSLYQAALESGVRRIVYSSSSAIYGSKSVPHHEELCPRPDTPYAAHKLLGEHYGLFFHQFKRLESIYLRYFNVYGPRQLPDSPYSGVISLFMDCFLKGQAPHIFDDGLQTRDFVYVDDVVEANLKAALALGVSGESFNVASGRPVSILELYNLLAKLSKHKNLTPKYLPPRDGDIRHSAGPIDKAQRCLNFTALTSFEEGLRQTWEWFQDSFGQDFEANQANNFNSPASLT